MANGPWASSNHLDRFLVLGFNLLFSDRVVINDISAKIGNKEYWVIRREQAAMWMWTWLTLLIDWVSFMSHKASYLFGLVVLQQEHSYRGTGIVAHSEILVIVWDGDMTGMASQGADPWEYFIFFIKGDNLSCFNFTNNIGPLSMWENISWIDGRQYGARLLLIGVVQKDRLGLFIVCIWSNEDHVFICLGVHFSNLFYVRLFDNLYFI